MTAYFEYLRELLTRFFTDLGRFFSETFADPWSSVGENIAAYNDVFASYSKEFGGGGWFLFVLFIILTIGLFAGLIFLAVLGIRKYAKFYKKEVEKDELVDQVTRLNYELSQAIQEKDKILNMKLDALGMTKEDIMGETSENKVPSEFEKSRFPKLSYVDKEYENVEVEIDPVPNLTLEELCNDFRLFAASQLHLYYKIETIRQLFAGMATSKLIILEGISGTGKTSMPYALGKFFEHDASICSVQPSWKDRSELVGYYNEFTKKFNESEFLKAVYTATYRRDNNVVVLDEMNLARIEYYFAEFLSVMEMPNVNEWKIELINTYDESDPKNIIEGKLLIPQNLFFFGTANNDDSTFTISDKVYDRAISLFFDDKGIAFDAEYQESMKLSYVQLKKLYDDAISQYPVSEATLDKFDALDNFVIKKFKLAFGNRILKQLKTFIPVYVACGSTEIEGLDFIFTNKILKKFESLNIAFLKDELTQLNTELDKLFGKNTFKMAHNYIDNLIKMA